jgi:hypothetical protein
VYFLGCIDHLKVGGEAAYYLQGKIGVEVLNELCQFLTGPLVIFAAPNRALPCGLDKLIEFIAPLFLDEVADHGAKSTNVIAKRLILVFERDVLTP